MLRLWKSSLQRTREANRNKAFHLLARGVPVTGVARACGISIETAANWAALLAGHAKPEQECHGACADRVAPVELPNNLAREGLRSGAAAGRSRDGLRMAAPTVAPTTIPLPISCP